MTDEPPLTAEIIERHQRQWQIHARALANYVRRLAEHPDTTPPEARSHYGKAREAMIDALQHQSYCKAAAAVAETLSEAADRMRGRFQ